jgi:hypothetical protein
MATKKTVTRSRPKLTAATRAKLAEKAKAQWAAPDSKLRKRHSEGRSEARRNPPRNAVALIKMACGQYGANLTTIAQLLQCHPHTLRGWRQRFPAIEEAITEGRRIEEDRLWSVLFKLAVKDENLTAAIVSLKMRFHYRDSGPVPGERPESPQESAAKIRAALKAMEKADDGGSGTPPVAYD